MLSISRWGRQQTQSEHFGSGRSINSTTWLFFRSSVSTTTTTALRQLSLLRPQVHLEHSSVGRLSRNPTGASNRVINSKGALENCSRRRGDTLLDAGSTWLILVRLMVTSYIIHGTSLQVVFYCCQVPKVYPLAAQSYSLGDSKIHG